MLKIMKDRMTKYMHRGEKGFTLIELLVVVAILGAIAAVVVLNVGGFIGAGECQAYCTEKHNIQTAIIAWGADNPGTTFITPVDDDYDAYLVGGEVAAKYDWSAATVDTDGMLGNLPTPPTGCTC